jgi:LuxR family quorum-sensing transcriptional regulator LasR
MNYQLKTDDLLALLHAPSEPDLQDQALALCQRLGFEFFVYGWQRPQGLVLHSTYPRSWQRLYAEQNLLFVDPTVRHAQQSCLPLIWNAQTFASNPEREMYDAARAHSIRSGLSLPFHGAEGAPAMLSLASDLPMGEARDQHCRQTLPEAMLLASYVNEAAQRLVRAAPPLPPAAPAAPAGPAQSTAPATAHRPAAASAPPPPTAPSAPREPLTAREIECLQWTMAGKSSWETGQIIGCTERTVNFHIGNAMRKLEVNNRRCAVVKALSLELFKA